jgi:hypothetical protein
VQAVAGYSEVFDKYTFVTIKGAGHEVVTLLPLFCAQPMLM